MLRKMKYSLVLLSALIVPQVFADTTIPLFVTQATGQGESVGIVTVSETPYGLLFTPQLHHLTPGVHGFHIHVNPSCNQQGMAAGGHFDPKNTGKHLGPYRDGHLGDLPVLIVAEDGSATIPVLAPRLTKLTEIHNHALMIHEGGDNYSDSPNPLGGGGGRMECGVISK